MDKSLNIRIKSETLKELHTLADAYEIPYSQIVRDAIREKCAKLQKRRKSTLSIVYAPPKK